MIWTFLLITVIHCEWDDWVIGECSRSCGTGTRTNNRTKLVEEANGGTCSGQPSEIVECNTQPCPGIIKFLYRLIHNFFSQF